MEVNRDDDDAGHSLSQENKLSIPFSRNLYKDIDPVFSGNGNVEGSFKMKAANLPKDFD